MIEVRNLRFILCTIIVQRILSWVITPNNTIVSKIVKLENINEELSNILETKVNLIKVNSSTNKNYIDYFTKELKEYVYKKYELDFKLFNYNF